MENSTSLGDRETVSSPISAIPQSSPRPSSSKFPTTLADLQPTSDAAHTNIYKSIKSLRRSTLSTHNRLGSIISDSTFVQNVASHYDLPLVANERCGSWYIPPHLKVGSAYFKSTDGHHGEWSFSTRRLNLDLLSVLGERCGAVLVDSTRRGKSLPDALSKTVPIWVSVVNRVLFGEDEEGGADLEVWAGVGESERSQIEAKVEGWCKDFKMIELDLQELRTALRRPIRCVWAINGQWEGVEEGLREGYYNLLVLCSASRRVRGAEASEGGYVQGSGDDHEGWSHGLTSDLFWEHKETLFSTAEEELPELITKLMMEEDEKSEKENDTTRIKAVGTIWVGKKCRSSDDGWDLVINCQGNSGSSGPKTLDLNCRQTKLGSKDLRAKLPSARLTVATALEGKCDCSILITCGSGRDLSVGVAVALLCLCYGDDGKPVGIVSQNRVIDKQLVKKRLAWITSSKPDANPSRATLQAVNSFLMDRPL